MNRLTRRLKAVFWEFIAMKLRCTGYIPSHMFRRFVYRFWGVKIGKGSTIHMFATFYYPRNIVIGEDTVIGEGVLLDGRDKLIFGSHIAVATEAMFFNGEHNISDESFKAINAPIVVEDYVFIGPRAIILPGVTIKKGSVVAAGAVVTKDVEEFMIVGGVPARVISERKVKNPNYKVGRAAWFR